MFQAKATPEEVEAYTQEKEQLFRDIYADVRPVKGLENLLQTLKMAGVPMAVATSAPLENVDYILRRPASPTTSLWCCTTNMWC